MNVQFCRAPLSTTKHELVPRIASLLPPCETVVPAAMRRMEFVLVGEPIW